MAPIINVQWEFAARLSSEVSLLKTEVSRQNSRITANQVALAEIQQQLADGVNAIGGGGMGWPLFKNAAYFRFVLAPNVPTKIVEATPETTLRQLRFRLLSGTEVYLSGSETSIGSDWNPLQLNQGMLFQDDHDGGSDWYAMAPNGATILIEVRTAEQAQQAGEDFVIPFKAEPIISAVPNQPVWDLNRLKGFVGNVNAFRALDIVSFHPGQKYTFTIEISEDFAPWIVEEASHPNSTGASSQYNRYGSKCVEVYAPNLYANLPEMAIAFLGNSDINLYDSGLIGFAKQGGWIASLGKNGGTFDFFPDYSRRHLFFFVRCSEYAPGDFGTGFAKAASFIYDSPTKTITIVGA